MKKKLISLVVISFFTLNITAGFFDFFNFGRPKNDEKLIISPGVQEKQHNLNFLKKESENLSSTEKETIDNIQYELNTTNKKISEIKDKLKEEGHLNDEFLNKELAKLNEVSQLLIDMQLKRKNILSILNQHIELLETYLKDSSFRNKLIEPKASYSFESLNKLQKDIIADEQEISCLNDERLNTESSIETLKKDLISLDKELKIKEKEQKKFATKIKESAEENDEKLNLLQKGELLDLDIQILNLQKRLTDLKLKEEQQKLNFVNTKLFYTDSIYKILKNSLPLVEQSLSINEADIRNAKKDLANKTRESSELQAKYSEEIRKLSQEKEKSKQDFEKINRKYKIQNLKLINDWSIDIKAIEFEPALYQLGFLNDKIVTLERGIQLKETQRDYEKEKIRSEEILVDIIDFWSKISQKRFQSEEEIEAERKKYESLRDDLNKELSNYKEKISTINNIINNQPRIYNNLREKIKSLSDRSEKYISTYGKETFKSSLSLLNKSEEKIKIQNDLNSKLIENCANILSILKDSLQKISIVLAKIENIGGILLRSKYAISIENIKNIIPDLNLYLAKLTKMISTSFSLENIKYSLKGIGEFTNNLPKLRNLLIFIILLLIIFFVLKKILPYISLFLLSAKPGIPGLSFINNWSRVIINFISANFTSLFSWTVIFLLTKLGYITNFNFSAIFYIFSIVYLCYESNKFIKYTVNFNRVNNYFLISPHFEHRFILVFSFFIYSTIIVFFFIESYTSIIYGKLELPTILLAIYSIIFRASLIFLIGKDEILNLIPDKPQILVSLKNFISRFYYLLLIGIIVIMIISDPYIGGFSKLVSYVTWSVIYTILLITGLWWFQIIIRKISSVIFFKSEEEDESTRERFAYAKTFYGFFSVLSFLFFILLAILIGSRIWSIPISFEKISEYLNLTIFAVRGEGDQVIPINIKSFVTLFSFLFFGFIIAWAFERFILRRIFNILLVDQGVQNTISSVTYYLIIIIVLLVGLLRIGLSGMIPFLVGALAVGLAFAIKGPANDIIGYFILLIERSVKIGDYIEIDSEVRGVVRKITPRSVVLRKRNSVSVIIPNSQLTNSVFHNWNYTPGFTSFNDILLTIPFSADPDKVCAILKSVLSSNSNILKSPPPIVWLDSFAEHGFVFLVRGFISSINILNQWEIASEIRISIVKSLREQGIAIAAPVRIIVSEDTKNKDNKIKQ